MGVNIGKSKTQAVKKRTHNIPHYTPLDKFAAKKGRIQPFAKNQTLFHMPVTETINKRIEQYTSTNEVNRKPENPYSSFHDIYDGLAKAATYTRLATPKNIMGRWVGRFRKDFSEQAQDSLSLFEPPSVNVSVSIKEGTPIRHSIAAPVGTKKGGEEQVEIRVHSVEKLKKVAYFKVNEKNN